MLRSIFLLGLGLGICLFGAGQLFASTPDLAAASKALAYTRSQQNTDGGFPDFTPNGASSAGGTIDAVFALASAGIDPNGVTSNGKSPADYLAAQAASFSATAGGAAKLALGIATLRADPASFGGTDVLSAMQAGYDASTGQYGSDLFAQSQFILSDVALHRLVPAAAIAYLESLQKSDGGWEYDPGAGTDTNTTALAVRALIAAGVTPADAHITNAISYFHSTQLATGAWEYTSGAGADPDSTGMVIQALVAAGEDLDAGGPWDKGGGKTPVAALAGFQNAATGALQYAGADSPEGTYQGLPGLRLVAYPDRQPFATVTTTPTTTTATSTATPTSTMTPTTRGSMVTATSSPSPALGVAHQLPGTGVAVTSEKSDHIVGLVLLALGALLAVAGAGTLATRK